MKKRILLGLAVMILIQFSAEKLMLTFGAGQSIYGNPPSIIAALAAAFAGGWVAQRGFVVPALLLWAVLWCTVVYLLYRIAAPVDPAALASIFRHNVLAIACSGAAITFGAALGQVLSQRRARRNLAALQAYTGFVDPYL
ncbi:hypothetical protein [Novilysobacter spongiicola]|uniref:hypothetical protein n=1 Tax=Novilysobacter spongiicola TaxID=435289 RepID=UPI001180C8B9|nr:hypothetical protein [Lysobacter spongiicola]